MIGERINNYEITALVGEGGMGTVYLAEHPVLRRRAAVKLLRPEYATDKNLVARFINEARASSAIHHPGIIEVFDVGTLPEGQPYLMMELLEGETLAQRIHDLGHLRVPEAIDITTQAAAALAAAHAHGIVHRDLKPDNLFLLSDPTQRSGVRVKVLDFGIAKLHRRWNDQKIRTHTGSLMGTPPYMSPEQCRGISSEIDHRTDVYALGIILYEMLVGAPPFMSEGFGDVLLMHLTHPPRPPRAIEPGIPVSLEVVVLRALEKEPERRYASMDELARALATSAARNTVLDVAPPPAVVELAPARPRRRVPSSIEPSTTFSSSVGQMSAVRVPYAKSTVHVAHRRQAIGALLGAGLAIAAGISFYMKGGLRPRPPARSAGPAAGAPAPVQEPPPARPALVQEPPPTAPALVQEPPRAPTAPVQERPATPAVPVQEPPAVPAAPVVVPPVPRIETPEAALKAPRSRRARIPGRRTLSEIAEPPPPTPAPRPVGPPARPIYLPAPDPRVTPPPLPAKPRVNAEKW